VSDGDKPELIRQPDRIVVNSRPGFGGNVLFASFLHMLCLLTTIRPTKQLIPLLNHRAGWTRSIGWDDRMSFVVFHRVFHRVSHRYLITPRQNASHTLSTTPGRYACIFDTERSLAVRLLRE